MSCTINTLYDPSSISTTVPSLPNISTSVSGLTGLDAAPDITLNTPSVSNMEFTQVIDNNPSVNSSGYFKELMDSVNKYIQDEFNAGRITGAEYSQVYLGALQFAITNSVQFAVEESKNAIAIEQQKVSVASEEHKLNIQTSTYNLQAASEKIKLENTITVAKAKLLLEEAKLKESLEVANAQVTKIKADNADTAERTKLACAKRETEAGQQVVLDKQAILYTEQAKAFKAKHNKDLAKVLTDNYVMVTSSDGVDNSSTSSLYGTNLQEVVRNASWPVV